MLATTVSYWKAFFDPENPNHQKARAELPLLDREKIVLSEYVIAEVCSWLISMGRLRQKNWFLDYAQNTANTRIFLFGREEFAEMARISIEKDLPLDKASLEYLRARLNCDVTSY